AQYAKTFRETAKRMGQWTRRENLDALFVAGSNEAAEPVWNDMPHEIRVRATLLKGEYARLSPAALQDRLAPEIEQWKRTQEAAAVAEILAQRNRKRAVLGVDETLRALQEGRVRNVLVARGVRGRVRRCRQCGWTDRAADRVCAACGGERRIITLREIVPELIRKVGVSVEVVAGNAARKLKAVGGMAAWLRE
ncbi:MAG: hypothetical protein ACREJU_00600, partial [Nitrospiraceae bacterium]